MSTINEEFTREDVTAMIARGELDMSDLVARRLSATQVVVEANNKIGVDVLSAPPTYRNAKLVEVLLYYFTLPDYAVRVAINEKVRRWRTVVSFFSFMENSFQQSTSSGNGVGRVGFDVPVEAVSEWRQHMMQTKTPQTTWIALNSLQKLLGRAMAQRYGKISSWPVSVRDVWVALRANTPSKPKHEKKPPLGMYLGISSDTFTDEELFMGLRYGAIWLLQKLDAQRKMIVEDTSVSEILQRNQGKTVKEFNLRFPWSTGGKKTNESPDRKPLVSAIMRCTQNDELLTEWQCYSFNKIRALLAPRDDRNRELFPKEFQAKLLADFDVESQETRQHEKRENSKDTAWAMLKKRMSLSSSVDKMPKLSWWGSILICHSPLERLLMVWLLASERAQKSGIQSMPIGAVHTAGERPTSLQVSTLKLRRASISSAKPHAVDVETQIYKRNDPPFIVYLNWKKIEIQAIDYFREHNSSRKFIYPLSSQLMGVIYPNTQRRLSSQFLPLELLTVEGTAWSNTFFKESNNSREAQAFVAILLNRKNEKDKNPRGTVAVPPSSIGQSLVVKKELSTNFDDSLTSIESETVGHSTTTGRNVYKDGFIKIGVKELVEPIRVFARRVGDEKMLLAEKIADEMASRASKVDFSELEQLCGIKTSNKCQRDLLELLDEQEKLTIAGEIELNGKLLVVESDFTAALMYGYIKHLEKSIQEIIATDREELALQHISRYLYLYQVFWGLEPGVRNSGQKLAAQMKFPFPPLN